MATGLDRGLARLGAALAVGLLLAGCGVFPPKGQGPREDAGSGRESAPQQAAVQPAPEGRFQQPGELDRLLDRLLDAKPINFPAVKPAGQAGGGVAAKPALEPTAGKGRFRIQVGAENDIDAAQSKKAEYERKLGGTVDVVFDAPYYKLRWGFFETKQDADDKILEIADLNIQGFVVKQ